MKKATWPGGTEVKRIRCLKIEFSLLPQLDVLYHRLGHLGEQGWLSSEEKSFPKLWLDVDTCVREQVRSKRVPSSLCLGTACLPAMRREGSGVGGILGQENQAVNY